MMFSFYFYFSIAFLKCVFSLVFKRSLRNFILHIIVNFDATKYIAFTSFDKVTKLYHPIEVGSTKWLPQLAGWWCQLKFRKLRATKWKCWLDKYSLRNNVVIGQNLIDVRTRSNFLLAINTLIYTMRILPLWSMKLTSWMTLDNESDNLKWGRKSCDLLKIWLCRWITYQFYF